MKKCILSIFIILILIAGNSYASNVSNETLELQQMQQEANEIMNSLENEGLNSNQTNNLIYGLFIVIGISMVFENFVRGYKNKIRQQKDKKESTKETRLKLGITYLAHILFVAILILVCVYWVKMFYAYIWFLVIATIFVVGISPLFTIRFKKKKEEEK